MLYYVPMAKHLYITTAIPYVNGKPHIGNALDYLYADIWARYQRQNGREVRFQVGTDEHGNKIATKAEELGLTPQEYTDKTYGNFEILMKKLGASYTDFIRTTDLNHKAAVQYIWQKLEPYIYKDKYEGWYCMGHEAFFTDKEVEATNGICPDHNTQYQKISEENYYLRASAFTAKIREAISTGRMEIVPETRKNEFLELIKEGMQDVSISRPRGSLSWGIPVPNDPEQVMYVWLDALSNYLTVIGYPNQPEWREYWPADIQVIGKDILRFHAGIWPAMLFGLEVTPPKKLLVHGHVNVGGSKMSKTVGNVVDPVEIIDMYGVDAFRYYFSRYIPTQEDGDFTWERFENAYNNELGNDLGNLVQRVANMVVRYQAGVIDGNTASEHDMQPYRQAIEALTFDRAIDEVWVKVRGLNKYLDTVKPWDIAKRRDTDAEAAAHLSEVLEHCVTSLLQIGDMLLPFMPNAADIIHQTFDSEVVQVPPALFPKIYRHTPDPRTQSNA